MSRRFIRLDRNSIRRLKSGERITEHGIMAERLPDGDVRYSVNIMVDGQRIHRVIGRESEGTTRTQCEEFVEAKRTEARQGRLSLPKGRKTALGFREAADNYLERLDQIGGRNMKAKRRQITLYLKPFFGDQRLDAIASFAVDSYKKTRNDAGASNGTVNRELSTLSHLLNAAVEWKWITARPCRITHLTESEGRVIALSDNQVDALLRAAIEDSDPDCWLFALFGFNTSMRHSEILASRFDQLDLANLRLHIPKAKAGMREQPITPDLARALQNEQKMREDANGWIFPSPRPYASKTGHRDRMGTPFRRAVKRAGIDPKLVTPHVMRHTAISKLAKAGVNVKTIQKISGHKTAAMVMRYIHVHGADVDEAIKGIGRGVPEQGANIVAAKRTKI